MDGHSFINFVLILDPLHKKWSFVFILGFFLTFKKSCFPYHQTIPYKVCNINFLKYKVIWAYSGIHSRTHVWALRIYSIGFRTNKLVFTSPSNLYVPVWVSPQWRWAKASFSHVSNDHPKEKTYQLKRAILSEKSSPPVKSIKHNFPWV